MSERAPGPDEGTAAGGCAGSVGGGNDRLFRRSPSGQRAESRQGYRASDSSRGVVRRMGKRKPRVPRDCKGGFSAALFERSQRSEKARVEALASGVRLQGSAFDFGEALHCRRGTLQRLWQNLENARLEPCATGRIGSLFTTPRGSAGAQNVASKNVPPAESVPSADFFSRIHLENRDRPSVATTSLRRPYHPLGARAVTGQRVRLCGALPCCESRGMHWCGTCRGGGAVVMVTTTHGDFVIAQA